MTEVRSTPASFAGAESGAGLEALATAERTARAQAAAETGDLSSELSSMADEFVDAMSRMTSSVSSGSASSGASWYTALEEVAPELATLEVASGVGLVLLAGLGVYAAYELSRPDDVCSADLVLKDACAFNATGQLDCTGEGVTIGGTAQRVVASTDAAGLLKVACGGTDVTQKLKLRLPDAASKVSWPSALVQARVQREQGKPLVVSRAGLLPTSIAPAQAAFAAEVSPGAFQCPATYSDAQHPGLAAPFTGASYGFMQQDPAKTVTCHYHFNDGATEFYDAVLARPASAAAYETCGFAPTARDAAQRAGKWNWQGMCKSADPADCRFGYVDAGSCPNRLPDHCGEGRATCWFALASGEHVPGLCIDGPGPPDSHGACVRKETFDAPPACSSLQDVKPPLQFCTLFNNGGMHACAAPVGSSQPWVCGLDVNLPDQAQQKAYCDRLQLQLCSTGDSGFAYAASK